MRRPTATVASVLWFDLTILATMLFVGAANAQEPSAAWTLAPTPAVPAFVGQPPPGPWEAPPPPVAPSFGAVPIGPAVPFLAIAPDGRAVGCWPAPFGVAC